MSVNIRLTNKGGIFKIQHSSEPEPTPPAELFERQKGKKRAVIAKPDMYTTDMKKVDVYATNDTTLSDKEIVNFL